MVVNPEAGPQTLELPPAVSLSFSIESESFDDATLTFKVKLYTGAVIPRFSWARMETFELVLEMTSEACDLSRLNSGRAPFLLDHSTYSVANDVLGVFKRAWLEGGALYGEVQASGRAQFAEVIRDLKAGILANVSVGTDIIEGLWSENADSKLRRLTAKKWRPVEGSLVAIGADPNAEVLSHQRGAAVCKPLQPSNSTMDENAELTNSPAPTESSVQASTTGGTPAAITASAQSAGAIAGERSRVLQIQKIGKKLRASDADVDRLIASGATIDRAREELLNAAADVDDASATGGPVQVLREAAAGNREAMEAYLSHRIKPGVILTNERARSFVGMTLVDMARHCLTIQGIKHVGLSRHEIVRLALHSTSDFPEALANTANKTLQAAFQAYQSGWREIVRIRTAADFKQLASISVGDMPPLLKVTEGGEITSGTFGESAEKYALATYGRSIGVTRQLIVNDDLDFLSRIPAGFGVSAASLIADLVFGILTANAALSDGVALFHATHANLGDKVLSVAGVSQMRALFRKQTGPNGVKINVAPKYWVVPAILETEALQIFVQEINPALVTSANPWKGTGVPIIEPRLDAAPTVYYAVADPAMMDGIEVAFLEGAGEAPMVDSYMDPKVDGFTIRTRLDVAAKAVQHRGLGKSSGTV